MFRQVWAAILIVAGFCWVASMPYLSPTTLHMGGLAWGIGWTLPGSAAIVLGLILATAKDGSVRARMVSCVVIALLFFVFAISG